MPTRDAVVHEALGFDGLYNGDGYDCANRFSDDMGRTKEAWCLDFVDDVARLAGAPLFLDSASVPDLWAYAASHSATRRSWEAQPGDPIIYCWPGGNPDGDHVELTVYWKNDVLRTIGGNSSPSNVNGYQGIGGVHQHDWDVPAGKGLSVIKGSLDLAKLCDLTKAVTPPAKPKPTGPRPLELKSPMLRGADVKALQEALQAHGHPHLAADGVFGINTRLALATYQHTVQDDFGVAAAHTRHDLGLG